MELSPDDKALAEAAYARMKSGRSYRAGIAGGVMGGFIASSSSLFRHINDPHTSHRSVVFFSILFGLTFGGCIIAAFFLARQRKQDAELVRFFEKHYPDDCSWKQEEKILAAAEDLRLKAKVHSLIHGRA